MAPSVPPNYINGNRMPVTSRPPPPRESYDVPGPLRPVRQSVSDETSSSVQSPLSTDCSTVLSDDSQTPSVREERKFFNERKSGESPPPYQAPPRPPKPPHLTGTDEQVNLNLNHKIIHFILNNSFTQVFFPLKMVQRRPSNSEEIQYLDLDLVPQTPSPGVAPTAAAAAATTSTSSLKASDKTIQSESSIVYKKVDFVKTDAFNKMRQLVDEGYRKYQE